MLTRSRAALCEDPPVNSGADTGVPHANVTNQASSPYSTEAFAAPHPVLPFDQNLQEANIQIQSSQSVISSCVSKSSKSSATVRALRTAAEAKLARQQLERQVAAETQRRERELQLEAERRRIEELELAAELASIEASCSQRSSQSMSSARTAAWVQEQVSQKIYIPQNKKISDAPSFVTPLKNNNNQPCTDNFENLATAISTAVCRSKKRYELISFSGDPVEWLIFKKNYNNSKCLFSNVENLNRLRHALHGRARECVAILLATTDDPEEVLHMLEQSFARPELIVMREVAQVRNLPRLSHDLKEINSFACKIKNCISVLQLLNQPEHLHSPELIQSVLYKLTPLLRSKWVDFAFTVSSEQVPKCLKGGLHRWKTCKTKRCAIDGCLRFHHPLLHGCEPPLSKNFVVPTVQPSTSEQQNSRANPSSNIVTVTNMTTELTPKVLLRVIPVTVSGPLSSVETYALLDDGSTATLIDSQIARTIGAVGPSRVLRLEGVGGMSTNTEIQFVNFCIKGRYESITYEIQNAKTIDSLSLLSQTICSEDLLEYSHLVDLSQILTLENASPKILIGAEQWHLSIPREVREGSKLQPVATRTLLGWTLHGQSNSWTRPLTFVNHTINDDDSQTTFHQPLDSIINDFFKLESLGISNHEPKVSSEDQKALEILDSTSNRLPCGRFEVGLLWRDNILNVPDSYQHALSRFLSLEKRMQKEPHFAAAYKSFVQGMLSKGYAEIRVNGRLNLRILRQKFEELRPNLKNVTFIGATKCSGNLPVTADPQRFSSWLRLVRATARVYQACAVFKRRLEKTSPQNLNSRRVSSFFPVDHIPLLEASQIIQSEEILFQRSQIECFEEEIACCLSSTPIPKYSKLYRTLQLTDRDLFSRAHWKRALRLADYFWTRWIKEYLPVLIPRRQCQDSPHRQPMKLGDVVLIVDENLPRGMWPIGCITTLHLGKDGTVRVVEVKTKAGTFKRPVRKIVRLPTQ
ncbi:hypothetical protein ACJJTC_007005 [Scirpophaga incertulas]